MGCHAAVGRFASPRRREAPIAFADDSWSTKEDEESTIYVKLAACETGTSAGELRAEPRAMRLVNHPFRLDSQRLLSYLTSMRVLTLAVTPAISTTFWNTIYFYAASATAGNLSYDCARGRHCTVSAAASRRHVDAFLDLFTRESPRLERFIREESSQRAPPFFCGWWEYKLD